MMHRKTILFTTLTLCVVGQHLCPVHAQESASPPTPSALSEKSVADRSRPMDFPDFTKGKWKTNPPVKIMGV